MSELKDRDVYFIGAILLGILSLYCGIMFWKAGDEWIILVTISLVCCWFVTKWTRETDKAS